MKKSILSAGLITAALLTLNVTTSFAQRDLTVVGDIYYPNASQYSGDKENCEFMIYDKTTGIIKKSGLDAVQSLVYFKTCIPINGVVENPAWANGPNKLFSACPEVKVGIATNAPTHNLTNLGDTKLQAHVWAASTMSLGADQDAFAKFHIRNVGYDASIQIDNTGNTKNFQKMLFLKFNGASTELIKAHNTSQNFSPFILNGDGSMYINNGTSAIFSLASDGQLIMRNGSQKTFQFDITGMFRARRVKVDAEAWADFVFEPNYKLMPLNEVKEYISVNKHLPGVPSEKELVADGIDLADMNKLLMQKVEELTLHLIQQQEQLNALQLKLESSQTK